MILNIDFVVFAITYLFAQPLYLLIVNIPFICKKSISYDAGIIYMFSVIIFNVIYTIIIHKIKTGYFIGDVPVGIYCLMTGIPILILTAGMGIVFLIKSKHQS